jgi:intracellular septation protein
MSNSVHFDRIRKAQLVYNRAEMKPFFDYFPLVLFYATFQFARHYKELAAQKASEWLGFMVSGGSVGPAEAPTVLATVVVVLAIAFQVGWLLVRRKKVGNILWITLVTALIFGGATVWFHNPTFIKWKFSIVYWAMGTGFLVSQHLFGKNIIQGLISDGIKLSDSGWMKLNLAWAAFFFFLGTLNICIAYAFSENFWFNFKLFGSTGLIVLFAIAQAVVLARPAADDA